MHPHLELLSSIKVFSGKNLHQSQPSPILDLVFITDVFSRSEGKLKLCYFEDSEWKEENSILKNFKRIKNIEFDSHEDSLIKLKMLKKTSIQEIEELVFESLNSKEFEEITNSQNYNFKIQKLIYRESWESISDLALWISQRLILKSCIILFLQFN